MFVNLFLFVLTSNHIINTRCENEVKMIINEINDTLSSLVDDDGLFDWFGSLDVAVWKQNAGKKSIVYQQAFGMSQYKRLRKTLSNINGELIWDDLEKATSRFEDIPNVPAENSASRNIYRVASNTKSIIGVAALMMKKRYGLDLDEKVSPKYIDLTSLGQAHRWHNPDKVYGYTSKNFPNSSVYASAITFRHLLTHTSGLSRESKRENEYSFGSSRTYTPACPSSKTDDDGILCHSNKTDRNWEPWVQHIVQYMMPACGYEHYDEKSNLPSCLPGDYYHYSNAGFTLLGLALNTFIMRVTSMNLENWITENIFHQLDMHDTVFSWADMSENQKYRCVHGCYKGHDIKTCNPKLPITDFADRGIKTIAGGIWSTVSDLSKFLLGFHELDISYDEFLHSTKNVFKDKMSEEDNTQMPLEYFDYRYGSYIAKNFTCDKMMSGDHFQGAWGYVPGYTSYTITNSLPRYEQSQYSVVILRSQNFAKRLNIGNQARRLLWRLLHSNISVDKLNCPVVVLDSYSIGDVLSN